MRDTERDGAPYQFEDRWINLDVAPKAEIADFSESGPAPQL